MDTSRHSISTVQSGDATIFGTSSAPTSPRSIPGHEEQRQSSCSDCSRSSHEDHSEHLDPAPRHGWPLLAHKMAEVPEFAAFCRFGDLNTRNLLYYQVQLKSLRQQILEEEDRTSCNLGRYDLIVDDADSHYHKLLIDLRSLLREYSRFPC